MAALVCLKYLHAGRLSEETSNVPEGNVSEAEKTEGKQVFLLVGKKCVSNFQNFCLSPGTGSQGPESSVIKDNIKDNFILKY